MARICTSPYPSSYPIEKVGDFPYPYLYLVNVGILRQNRDEFGQGGHHVQTRSFAVRSFNPNLTRFRQGEMSIPSLEDSLEQEAPAQHKKDTRGVSTQSISFHHDVCLP